MASYACPGMRAMAPAHTESGMSTVAATGSRGAIGRMGSAAAAVLRGDGSGAEYAGTDPMAPNLCVGHCQLGQQQKSADGTAAQLPPAAPPHATLHCCWRN